MAFYPAIEKNLNHPKRILLTDQLPKKTQHGWRYIKFGPDGWLYIAIGAPCNVCISKDPRFATISRMRPDGSAVICKFLRGVCAIVLVLLGIQ